MTKSSFPIAQTAAVRVTNRSESDPVFDGQSGNVAGKKSLVVGHERGPAVDRSRGDQQVDSLLTMPRFRSDALRSEKRRVISAVTGKIVTSASSFSTARMFSALRLEHLAP